MAESIQELLARLPNVVTACAAALNHPQARARGHVLSLAQHAALDVLRESSGLTVPQVARRRGTSRQNVQASMDRLAAMGMVDYVSNPDHKRSERLRLTAAGRRALGTANRRVWNWLSELSTDVSAEELQACLRVLEGLRVRLGSRHQVQSPPMRRTNKPLQKEEVSSEAIPESQTASSTPEEISDASPPEALPVNLL